MSDASDEYLEQQKCDLCGNPLDGFSGINDEYYCHPDDPTKQDCYAIAQTALWQLRREIGVHTCGPHEDAFAAACAQSLRAAFDQRAPGWMRFQSDGTVVE